MDRSFQRRAAGPMIWFRMNVGRNNNADPKWIVPVICRLGRITKNEIGVIKIFDKETKFEILEEAAQKFAASVRRASGEENVNIQPAAGSLQEIRKFAPKAPGSYIETRKREAERGQGEGKPRSFDKPREDGERKGKFKKDFAGPAPAADTRPPFAGKPGPGAPSGPKKFGKKHRPKAD